MAIVNPNMCDIVAYIQSDWKRFANEILELLCTMNNRRPKAHCRDYQIIVFAGREMDQKQRC